MCQSIDHFCVCVLQCSPLSTCSGFKAQFESARRLSQDPKVMLAMVVLDELGLADLSPEKPIKVLHHELERKAVLTSGESQQSNYSVVALSNWLVDAAQLNRGILISRTAANHKDLLESAKQLATSLIGKFIRKDDVERADKKIANSLEMIVDIYQQLDHQQDIGGGHFYSMRDFFFCVKNFVCSVFNSTDSDRVGEVHSLHHFHISDDKLIKSGIRNFGGHDRAQKRVRAIMSRHLRIDEAAVAEFSPMELIVENIGDSSKNLSVHIARHLMILNRSLIALQLLNRHTRSRLDAGLGWHVLFGSCFPGDLHILSVTRKLRQVEQAIRTGGVLVLCHADQLFESMYMVLNQQYWAQDQVTMTQIALGPSVRSIALPAGPFRIIALQDTDVALNRDLMSPAILSRFEKHELRLSHLLSHSGRYWLSQMESHPVWLSVTDVVKRKRLLYGYHEECLASLGLHLQEMKQVPTDAQGQEMEHVPMDVEERAIDTDGNIHSGWLWALNPMAVIKLERDPRSSRDLLQFCKSYRTRYILDGLEDALDKIRSRRIVVMTNTLRHLEICCNTTAIVIRLFDIQTELELYAILESMTNAQKECEDFRLVVQYDATSGPIEQFQLTKYEIECRLKDAKCRVAFVIHVDPQPINMHWVLSFGDGWEYCFVDDIAPVSSLDQMRIPLSYLTTDRTVADFIHPLSQEPFKLLLLQMLGPVLQMSLSNLGSSLGQFYGGVRTALSLADNTDLIQLLKECLLAQLDANRVCWNVVDAVDDVHFDSSSSLTEALWGVLKHRLANPLSHLLLVSDVWRVADATAVKLWCRFVRDVYPDRLMVPHSQTLPPMPTGFRICTQPFGRLFSYLNKNYVDRPGSQLNGPLRWLLHWISRNEADSALDCANAYFLDWMLLRVPPHLNACVQQLPLSKMASIVSTLFQDPESFFQDWTENELRVIESLEMMNIVSFAVGQHMNWNTVKIRSWKTFSRVAVRLALHALANPALLQDPDRFLQSVTSIEVSVPLSELIASVDDAGDRWLGLRITKRMLIFDPECDIKLANFARLTPGKLIDSLTDMVVHSVIRPRTQGVRSVDLHPLLVGTVACNSAEELSRVLLACPTSHGLLLKETAACLQTCPHCGLHQVQNHFAEPNGQTLEAFFRHLQDFLFFFERVAELFIQQRRNNPQEIRDLLHQLLHSPRLRVSWRFLTVIVRTILATRSGDSIINTVLSGIQCNQPLQHSSANSCSLLRALLAWADEDVLRRDDAVGDVTEATMEDRWTLDRIRRLAVIRKALSEDKHTAQFVLGWNERVRHQVGESVADACLYFVLRFATSEGDQTKLKAVLSDERMAECLVDHPVVGPFMQIMSPLSLGFDLIPADQRACRFERHLMTGGGPPSPEDIHYELLQEVQPGLAPFIARLVFHLADVADAQRLSILQQIAIRPVRYFLPGVDNHVYLNSFELEPKRWYVCDCGTPNCVHHCGRPVTDSLCVNCRVPLAVRMHEPRSGVRSATVADFAPPKGFSTTRLPDASPTLSVRGKTPLVTRCSLLLTSLALMKGALDPRMTEADITLLLHSLPVWERPPTSDRRALIQLLSSHIVVHLDVLIQLLVTTRQHVTKPDQFRVVHLLLHKLMNFQHPCLQTEATGPSVSLRDGFENALGILLGQHRNLELELDQIANQSDQRQRIFYESLSRNETTYWAYARRVFADRHSVQLEMARDPALRQAFPFLNLVLDDENWANKLDALQFLGWFTINDVKCVSYFD